MRKKATITFTIDAHYPNVNEEDIKKLGKDFDLWLKEWAMDQNKMVPILYETSRAGTYEVEPNARVTVKIRRGKEVILDTAWAGQRFLRLE